MDPPLPRVAWFGNHHSALLDESVPRYTSDLKTNRVLLNLGVTRQAVTQLRRLPTIVYASAGLYVELQVH